MIVEREITQLWRQAAQAAADGFPKTLAGGLDARRLPEPVGHALVPGTRRLARRGVGRRPARAGVFEAPLITRL